MKMKMKMREGERKRERDEQERQSKIIQSMVMVNQHQQDDDNGTHGGDILCLYPQTTVMKKQKAMPPMVRMDRMDPIIETVKQKIQDKEGIPPDRGRTLDDDRGK